MRRATLVATAGSCVLLLGGCLLTTSLDGLSGGGAASADGGARGDASSAGAGDAAASDAARDALASLDGGSDAFSLDAAGGDAALPATFCQLPPSASSLPRLFCDDFEETHAQLALKWTDAVDNASIDAAELVAPPSPGHSLLLDVESGVPGPSDAKLSFPTSYSKIQLSFDIVVDSAPASANTYVAGIELPGASAGLYFMLGFGGSAPQLQAFVNGTGQVFGSASGAGWTTGQFVHLDIVLSLSTSGSTAYVMLNKSTTLVPPATLSAAWVPSAPRFVVESDPQGTPDRPAKIHVDNVEMYAGI